MNRRHFLATAASAAVVGQPLIVAATTAHTTRRICVLVGSAGQRASMEGLLTENLRRLGYADGRKVSIEFLSADDALDRLGALATQCVRLRPDIIVTTTTPAALAAKRATETVPIVTYSSDPVVTGIVSSLGRPGANVTGVTDVGPGLGAKCLEFLKQIAPRMRRLAVLANLADPAAESQIADVRNGSQALAVRLTVRNVATPEHVTAVVPAAVRDGDEALLTTRQSLFFARRVEIAGLALRHRVPAVSPFRAFAEAGGVLAYSPDFGAQMQTVATQIDKILKGARPGDIPVEQPTKFELVLNLRTAKALDLTIPASLLLRADHVIE